MSQSRVPWRSMAPPRRSSSHVPHFSITPITFSFSFSSHKINYMRTKIKLEKQKNELNHETAFGYLTKINKQKSGFQIWRVVFAGLFCFFLFFIVFVYLFLIERETERERERVLMVFYYFCFIVFFLSMWFFSWFLIFGVKNRKRERWGWRILF